MLFTSFLFLGVFLPVTLLAYWALPPGRARLVFLLVASSVFYAWWDWRYVPLLIVSTSGDWLAGEAMARTSAPRLRRLALVLAIALNLGLLAYFKYRGFFLDSLNGIGDTVGLGRPFAAVRFVLPLGISFYTFNAISYAVDVYRGKAQKAPTYLHFAVFVALFPSLLAGPIVRWTAIDGQLRALPRRLTATLAASGLVFMAAGLAKKLLVADLLAPYVNRLFAAAPQLGFAGGWGAAVGYALQLYFDFSGYSDIAVGVGLLLGLRLPQNFDSPYKSATIGEFWRRWHMSLSFWLRDYLFIPLGGSREGKLRTVRNLAIVMFLGGLWHGAAWTFVVWGLLHGVYLILDALYGGRLQAALPPWAMRALTFAAVCVAWVFFRAASLAQAREVLTAMTGVRGWGSGDDAPVLALRFSLLVVAGLVWVNLAPNTWELSLRPRWPLAVATGLLLGAAVLAIGDPQAFVYFRF